MTDENVRCSEREWPDGMTVTVEDDDAELSALLFSRAAWNLPAGRDVPRALLIEPAMRTPPGDRAELSRAWDEAWESRLAHAGDFDDFDFSTRKLDDYFTAWREARDERPDAWQDRHFTDADTKAFDIWSSAVGRAAATEVRPEMQPILVDAWRDGLTHVTLVPLVTPFARRLTERRILLSTGTWANVDHLRAALRPQNGRGTAP